MFMALIFQVDDESHVSPKIRCDNCGAIIENYADEGHIGSLIGPGLHRVYQLPASPPRIGFVSPPVPA